MSLCVFNSRLIQPAGDRLFSGAGAAGRSWAESIVLHPAGADQREAAPQSLHQESEAAPLRRASFHSYFLAQK
jgi:hypothetical protein